MDGELNRRNKACQQVPCEGGKKSSCESSRRALKKEFFRPNFTGHQNKATLSNFAGAVHRQTGPRFYTGFKSSRTAHLSNVSVFAAYHAALVRCFNRFLNRAFLLETIQMKPLYTDRISKSLYCPPNLRHPNIIARADTFHIF